jgi:hypothetical protein
MYFFRDDTSPNDLLSEQIGADGKLGPEIDSPLHTSEGFQHPLRVSPDGKIVILGSGMVHDAETLARQINGLGNAVSDVAWMNGNVYTVRNIAGVAQFQQWTGSTFAPGAVSQVPGTALALLSVADSKLVAITSPASGVPEFRLMNAAFNVVPPPTNVTQVFVNGPGLTGQASANGIAFRTLAGVDSTYGYPVPGGANQLKSIPWSEGINKIAIRFGADVAASLQREDLVVKGLNTPTYATSGFTYDAATRTGVWTLATPVTRDKINLVLDDALLPTLDGEWATGKAFPSGDGTPGGDFAFRINVLRGDANQDGAVNALDLGQLKAKLNRTATNPGAGATGYSVFADLNADGQINALDLGFAKLHLNDKFSPGPTPEPALLFGRVPVSA